jgi:putative heme iron utilization protein
MSTTQVSVPRHHAYSEPQQATPEAEPSYAERVRTLVSLSSVGTLSTLSRKHAGFPFGSLMPYALDTCGNPIFLISSMAMHTQNIKADPRASLFIGQNAADGETLGAARATLVGSILPVPSHEIANARECYLLQHASSRYWVSFSDFSFFQMNLQDIYYVGGFGVMSWVAASDYAKASPDPLATSVPGILSHMNTHHTGSLLMLARLNAGIAASEATMTSVDRLGFTLRLKTKEGTKGARINFTREVTTPQETRTVLVEMVREAKVKAWI